MLCMHIAVAADTEDLTSSLTERSEPVAFCFVPGYHGPANIKVNVERSHVHAHTCTQTRTQRYPPSLLYSLFLIHSLTPIHTHSSRKRDIKNRFVINMNEKLRNSDQSRKSEAGKERESDG